VTFICRDTNPSTGLMAYKDVSTYVSLAAAGKMLRLHDTASADIITTGAQGAVMLSVVFINNNCVLTQLPMPSTTTITPPRHVTLVPKHVVAATVSVHGTHVVLALVEEYVPRAHGVHEADLDPEMVFTWHGDGDIALAGQ
jgi:hypothetical protein